MDDEIEDNLKIGQRNWHTVARDRTDWMKVVLEAKVHSGL